MKNEKRRLAAIMFTDIVGFAAMTRRNEKLSLQLLERHHKLLRSCFTRFSGREIKSIGDGFLIEFASALEGARCAIAVQKCLRDHNRSHSPESQMQVRIGLHVGEVVERETDVFGDGVNIASRLEPLAEPGGICVSQQAYDQICNKLSVPVVPAGTFELDQLTLSVYRIDWAEEKLAAAPEAKSCKRSIGVLPFVNLSPSARDEYLSDGLTEELINALGRIDSLRVVSRTSAFAFKGKADDVRKIGTQLNVQTVLEGSLRRLGGELRIAVRLISVTDGFQIWAETYERRLRDVFGIQQEVTGRVIEVLDLKPAAPPELLRPATENPAAYQLYLKGRFHWNKRSSDGMAKALDCFRKAVQRDPRCALAYAGIADCYSLLAFYGGLPPRGTFAKAKAAARKAVKLNPALAETHTSLAYALMHHDWDFEGCAAEFRKALEINPSFVPAHLWYGIFLSVLGRNDEAIAEARKAKELEPLSASVSAVTGMIFYFARQYLPAAKMFREALEMEPGFVLAHEGWGQLHLQQRAWKKAIKHLEEALRHTRFGGSMIAAAAFGLARAGDVARARALLKRITTLLTRGEASPVSVAIAHIGLNQPDEAFRWLQRACQQRSGKLIYLKANPIFCELRADKRFEALARKIGLS